MAFMAAVQGLYFLITGIWPFLHMASFLKITGPKTDLWLVKTVGIVVSAIGIGLLVAGIARQVDSITVLIAVSSAAGLMAIDVAYVLKRVISPVYLVDAAVELLLIAGWGLSLFLGR